MKQKTETNQLGKRLLGRQEVPVLAATLLMAVVFSIFNSSFLSTSFSISR